MLISAMASGSKRKYHNPRDYAVCAEALENSVRVLPCVHAFHGGCLTPIWKAYEERKEEWCSYERKSRQTVSNLEYVDIPTRAEDLARPSCPLRRQEFEFYSGTVHVDYENEYKKTK